MLLAVSLVAMSHQDPAETAPESVTSTAGSPLQAATTKRKAARTAVARNRQTTGKKCFRRGAYDSSAGATDSWMPKRQLGVKTGPMLEEPTVQSLRTLYAENVAGIYGFLLARCGSQVIAEDLTVETFTGHSAAKRWSARWEKSARPVTTQRWNRSSRRCRRTSLGSAAGPAEKNSGSRS